MPQRKYYRTIYKGSRKKKIVFFLVELLIIVALLLIFTGAGLFIYYAKDFPRPEKFAERTFVQSTKIFDRSGEVLLYEFYDEEKRETISLEETPQHFKNAIIAAEDARFYEHFGLDVRGIIRAIKVNIKLRKPLQGASTITQQLIRSTFLTREKTIKRKIREVILTLELERRYSKDQILEWYINQVPFGPNVYGVEAASKTFFSKPAQELTMAESATLAALIQAPGYFSPYGEHIDELSIRKNYILDRLVQERYATEEEAEGAKQEEISFVEIRQGIRAPHFVFYVQEYLVAKYGRTFLDQKGLKIYTSLDWELQKIAEEVVRQGVARNKGFRAHNASLVAIDPKTGEILAMVGSADWFADPFPEGCTPGKDCLFDPKVNIATYNIGRQPGSAFKPFVYATAFQKGYEDTTTVIDEETNFGIFGGKPYIPQNYDGRFRGEVTLREALAQSINVPSVKVLAYLAGQSDSIENARRFGITTLTRPNSFYGLSIVLGGGEVKLLDMLSAYGVFATEGLRVLPLSVIKIEDAEGNIIEQNKRTPRRVLEREVARLISDILSDNDARAPLFGTRSPLYFADYQVAVKTGTTNDYRDAWTLGYTPSIVAGVWAGNNDNSPIARQPGVMISSPIWRAFMEQALLRFPKEQFTAPAPKKKPIEQIPIGARE